MAIKGQARTETSTEKVFYTGLTKVEVRAVNPTRAELNKLLDREDKDTDKEIEYTSTDQEGNERVRLTFWLYDSNLDKYFVHSFNLTNKVRMSNDKSKTQFINSTCSTGWADAEENLQEWFTNFQDKNRENIGPKIVREALLGEEELVILLRAWMGRMNFYNTDAEVLINTNSLFNEDYTELRELIDGDFDAPFVILLGVETDTDDLTKQYQKVYSKSFLPGSLMKEIEKNKFSDFGKKVWSKFESEVEGEYGFKAFYTLEALKEYNKEEDLNAQPAVKADVTPKNSKF